MLKFIWGKGHQPTAERIKLQKELFGFSKVSCLSHLMIKGKYSPNDKMVPILCLMYSVLITESDEDNFAI